MDAATSFTNYQAAFHQRWHYLSDPHVRALAWLLSAPNLLNPTAPQWQNKIASIDMHDDIAAWLIQLHQAPEALHQFLDIQKFTRLGRYAEKLLAWYFQERENLFAHGLQVRKGKEETLGEFDFLFWRASQLIHWEFASKFYLLNSGQSKNAPNYQAEYFVGPNLADTLAAKMRKILDRQLALGTHVEAQALLPQALLEAKALVKGWLFYRKDESLHSAELGLTEEHCKGWWCSIDEIDTHISDSNFVLTRLSWLAPARVSCDAGLTKAALQQHLLQHFEVDSMPVMVATMREQDGELFEVDRGFVVPSDWQQKALLSYQQGTIKISNKE
jgi:hypothetical protein